MSRELFNQTAKSSRASSLLRGLCRAEMRETRQIAAFSAQAGRHPMQETAIAPVGASSLLRGLCRAKMRETRRIAAFSTQTGRHPMQEVAIASVGARLSRELFNHRKELASKLAPTGFVPCRDAGDKADRSFLRPGRQAPHAGGCNCTCRSELVSRAFQPPQRAREQARSYGICAVQKCERQGRSQLSPPRPAGSPCRRLQLHL